MLFRSFSTATVTSATSVECAMPARGAGLRAVEIALSDGGEVSHSGMQVEYVPAGSVNSLWPSTGVVTGGTVVTVSGTGFAAGRTACVFGSAMAVQADVASAEEARCVVPAGAIGAVTMEVSTTWDGESQSVSAVELSTSEKMFAYKGATAAVYLTPAVAAAEGGNHIFVTVNGIEDGMPARCSFGDVVVDAIATNAGQVQCLSPASNVGNIGPLRSLTRCILDCRFHVGRLNISSPRLD